MLGPQGITAVALCLVTKWICCVGAMLVVWLQGMPGLLLFYELVPAVTYNRFYTVIAAYHNYLGRATTANITA